MPWDHGGTQTFHARQDHAPLAQPAKTIHLEFNILEQ